MSWEAFRLTSKSPAELYFILGPHAVDEKVGEMMRTCWREYAGPDRTLSAVRNVVQDVFGRNARHWWAIKKPTPTAFFENLLPHAADGHIRQAFVLCWMMMPRGKKSIPIVADVVTKIFERHLTAWEEDHNTLTKGVAKKSKKSARPALLKPKSKPKKRPAVRRPKPRR